MIDYSEFGSRNWSPASGRSRHTSNLLFLDFSEKNEKLEPGDVFWDIFRLDTGFVRREVLRKSLAHKG